VGTQGKISIEQNNLFHFPASWDAENALGKRLSLVVVVVFPLSTPKGGQSLATWLPFSSHNLLLPQHTRDHLTQSILNHPSLAGGEKISASFTNLSHFWHTHQQTKQVP